MSCGDVVVVWWRGHCVVIVVGHGDVADMGGMVVVNELTKEGSAHHDDIPEMTNDDDVVVHRLVATSPTAM